MTKTITKTAAVVADIMLFDDWFDPIEDGVRERVRGFIETMLEKELDGALSRPRYGRRKANGNEEAAAPLVGCWADVDPVAPSRSKSGSLQIIYKSMSIVLSGRRWRPDKKRHGRLAVLDAQAEKLSVRPGSS